MSSYKKTISETILIYAATTKSKWMPRITENGVMMRMKRAVLLDRVGSKRIRK